ncbi:MAG: phytanoyl-CoA dioxygenase family protein [Candidatus Poribacteria bacterium]|nr:phytanoyl-CoA dioxygenase family protein [Candidatus Poribacteria bacterium]
MALTSAQIDTYHQQGFVLAKGILAPVDTQPVIDELETFIDRRANELQAEEKIANLCAEAPFDQRYGLLLKQSSEIGQGMDIMQMRGPATFDFLRNSNLLDAVESLVGPEITCNPIQHVRAKPPSNFGHSSWSHGVPWHQDAAVMMKEAEGSNVITCWLPLSLSTIERGSLQVLPGVSKLGYLTHQKEGGTMIVPDLMPETEPAHLECDRGDVVFISRYTPHCSLPNPSDYCRWSMDLRYQPTGQHTGRTAHPDFVVRSAAHPEEVLTDHQTWCDLWIDAFENPRGVATHRTN